MTRFANCLVLAMVLGYVGCATGPAVRTTPVEDVAVSSGPLSFSLLDKAEWTLLEPIMVPEMFMLEHRSSGALMWVVTVDSSTTAAAEANVAAAKDALAGKHPGKVMLRSNSAEGRTMAFFAGASAGRAVGFAAVKLAGHPGVMFRIEGDWPAEQNERMSLTLRTLASTLEVTDR